MDDIESRLHREGISLATISKRSWAFFIDELILSVLLMVAMSGSFENAKSVEEINEASINLASLTNSLKDKLNKFKI